MIKLRYTLAFLGLTIFSTIALATSGAPLKAQFEKNNILRCDFTEPFFNIDYNSKTKVVTKHELGKDGEVINTTLSQKATLIVADKKNRDYVLVDEEGIVILKLKLSFNGSNGMSDHIYPFDAWYDNLMGACDTSHTPAVDADELIDSLL